MKITQHFAKLMVDKKLKGLIAFTSSSAGECCLACSARLVCKHVLVFSFIFFGCWLAEAIDIFFCVLLICGFGYTLARPFRACISLTYKQCWVLAIDKLLTPAVRVAGFVPNPLSSLYASTKSFLTLFATSVAAELRSSGIDVVVVHPSPIASNFFNDAGERATPSSMFTLMRTSHAHKCTLALLPATRTTPHKRTSTSSPAVSYATHAT
jgi:NAD(P)-dependent dehydrogenase (short-subunit alcohol dehydrogenase family)